MNGDQSGQGLQRAASMGPQTAVEPGRPSGAMEQAVIRLRKNNARFVELIHIQRDQHCRLSGTNPIDSPPDQEKPRAEGIMYDLIQEMEIFETNLGLLNQLTDAWGNL